MLGCFGSVWNGLGCPVIGCAKVWWTVLNSTGTESPGLKLAEVWVWLEKALLG